MKSEQDRRIVLLSGGMDSYIAWRLLGRPPSVYFAIGAPYQRQEVDRVAQLAPSTIIDHRLTLDDLVRPDGHIPLRNVLLVQLASLYGDDITLAGLAGETSRDKTPAFYRRMSRLLTAMRGYPIRVSSPLLGLTKSQAVARYLQQFPTPADQAALLSTHSCWQPLGGLACGECKPCFRRWVALTRNGLPADRTHGYPPLWEEIGLVRWTWALRDYPPGSWWGGIRKNWDAARALRQTGDLHRRQLW